MPQSGKIALITVGYWVLLLYILAALVWWYIALNRQNDDMAAFRMARISLTDPAYNTRIEEIKTLQQRKQAQYIGEGATFMLLIIVGAILVYRAVRRQLQLSQQQQNFLMAVTHELKTPLAIARLNVETLKKRKLEPDKQQQLLQSTLAETDRLNDLTNNILLTSRLDAASARTDMAALDLVQMLADIHRQYEQRYPHTIVLHLPQQPAQIHGDAMLLKIMVHNLLDNAIKYNAKGSTVSLTLQVHGQGCTLEVADRGPGIPDEEKRRVFDKFYRIGNEATRQTKGTGLGLYLCKKIATLHRAAIAAKDNVPTGAILQVIFSTAR